MIRKSNGKKSQWMFLLALIAVISIYSVVYAEGRTELFVVSCWLQMVLCACFVLIEQPRETLAPAKVAALLYTASFAVAPLWLADLGNYRNRYYGLNFEELMAATAAVTLTGYVFFLGGYFLLTRLRPMTSAQAIAPTNSQRRYMRICLLVTGALGMFFYLGLVMRSGGIGRLLGYIGGRADMFGNLYGGWFWGIHLLFAAYGLLAVLTIKKHPWWSLLFALLMSAMFVPLQGRDIVIAPIFCWLLLFHALRGRLSWPTIGAGAFCIILLASLLGAFRGSSIRDDAGSFLNSYFDRIGQYLVKTLSANIEQLNTAMTAVQYVEINKHTIGPMVLMAWVEPIDRALFGNSIPSIYSGVFIDLLLVPEHKGWNTAASPSLPGELYIGMGWLGVIVGMSVYGAVFGQLTRWYSKRNVNLVLFAGYPFVVYMLSKMIVDGTAHFFRVVIVIVVVFLCSIFAPTRGLATKRLTRDWDGLF